MRSPDGDRLTRPTFALVLVCEVVVIAGLWLVGRIYG